jgi:hypothetical protein
LAPPLPCSISTGTACSSLPGDGLNKFGGQELVLEALTSSNETLVVSVRASLKGAAVEYALTPDAQGKVSDLARRVWGHRGAHHADVVKRRQVYGDIYLSRPQLPFGHGYVNGTKWRDIMSYRQSCNGCPRIPYWSNPTIKIRGENGG